MEEMIKAKTVEQPRVKARHVISFPAEGQQLYIPGDLGGECPLPEGYTSVGKDGPAVHRLFRLVAWLSEDAQPALPRAIEPDSQ